ncbi:MAG: hypothetical protein Q9212_004916 [Teloschistes hypoglaucus]
MSLQTTSVLVIGGCGFLDRHVVSELLSASARVSVLDLHTGRNRLETVSCYAGDFTDAGMLHHVFQKVHPDAIIHSASPVVADFAGKVALYERVNVIGSRNLIERAGQFECVKGIAEQLILKANRQFHGMSTTAIRPVSMFGEGDVQQLPNMLQVYYDRKTYVQSGDNKIYFDFVYVGNVAIAHILALKRLLDIWSSFQSQPTLDIPQYQRVDGEAFLVINDQPYHSWDYARTVWAAAGDTTDPKDLWVIPRSVGMIMA